MSSEKRMQYAVLQYSPSLISGESINLGIVVASTDEPLFKFVETKKLARVREFDDTIDIEELKKVLRAIAYELETTLENCMQKFDISSFTQYYLNEYHFTRVIELPYANFDDSIKELSKLYLPYDFAKNQRASYSEEIKFIRKILTFNQVEFKRNVREIGHYQDNITYDFKIGKYGIKLFWLKGKELSRIVNDVKAWAWNCEHQPEGTETVIIYDADDESVQRQLSMILGILRDSSSYIYSWKDGIQWLSKLSSGKQA